MVALASPLPAATRGPARLRRSRPGVVAYASFFLEGGVGVFCRGCAWCSDRMTSVRWEAPRELTCPPLRSRCVCMIRCFVATMHVGPVRFLSFMRVGGERRPRPHWGGGGNPGGGVPLTTRGPAIYLFAPHLQGSSMYISPSCGGGARRRVGALSCSGGGGPLPSPNPRQDVPPPTPPPIPAAWRRSGGDRQGRTGTGGRGARRPADAKPPPGRPASATAARRGRHGPPPRGGKRAGVGARPAHPPSKSPRHVPHTPAPCASPHRPSRPTAPRLADGQGWKAGFTWPGQPSTPPPTSTYPTATAAPRADRARETPAHDSEGAGLHTQTGPAARVPAAARAGAKGATPAPPHLPRPPRPPPSPPPQPPAPPTVQPAYGGGVCGQKGGSRRPASRSGTALAGAAPSCPPPMTRRNQATKLSLRIGCG